MNVPEHLNLSCLRPSPRGRLKALCLFPFFVSWAVRTTALHKRGRLYVFRDAPDWFVLDVAISTYKPKNAFSLAYQQAARNELEVRVRRQFLARGFRVVECRISEQHINVVLEKEQQC